jgi:hypothetical protein
LRAATAALIHCACSNAISDSVLSSSHKSMFIPDGPRRCSIINDFCPALRADAAGVSLQVVAAGDAVSRRCAAFATPLSDAEIRGSSDQDLFLRPGSPVREPCPIKIGFAPAVQCSLRMQISECFHHGYVISIADRGTEVCREQRRWRIGANPARRRRAKTARPRQTFDNQIDAPKSSTNKYRGVRGEGVLTSRFLQVPPAVITS